MPAQQLRVTPLPLPNALHARTNSHDPIVPSSEGEENRSTPKKRKGNVRKRKPLLPVGEVIEISSDDESPALPNPIITDLRRQVKKLKEENAQCKQDLTMAEKELDRTRESVSEMQASLRPDKSKLILEVSHLEDQLNCEVCTGRLWSPHILPECGHIFCQTCLQEWFNTTLAHFLATHPHYDANNPMYHLRAFPHMPPPAAYQQAPQYTCPTCRATVQNKPVEVFALKALVRTIAAAAGESSPTKPPKVTNLRTGQNRVQGVQITGPWDGFFPRYM